MSHPTALIVTLRKSADTLLRHWRLVALCTLALTLFALVFALVRPDTWKATQALVVRDEAVGGTRGAGRFDSVDAMQTAQETILEVSRNPSVVAAALRQVGPVKGAAPAGWPEQRDIQELQSRIKVSAPKGAEFGRTELIYLSVSSSSRQRAVELTKGVCDQLERRLQALRDAKAASVMSELERQLHLAQEDLAEATARLEALEREVGSDLGELRTLNQLGVGDSNLRAALSQIVSELRQTETAREAVERQRELLLAARGDPDQLLATPNRLLEAQPSLRRLKEGVIEAQLRKSELLGRMSADHPQVLAAAAAEREVRNHLHEEIQVALRGLDAELTVIQGQAQTLRAQKGDVTRRLDRLAAMRATYSNLVNDATQRAQTVESVKKELGEARAARSAAQATSLLTRVDAPFSGDRPEGPSRAAIVLFGLVGGLATGVGAVFLITAPVGQHGRRLTDHLPMGRRAGDFLFGRRAEDRLAVQQTATPLRRATDPAAIPMLNSGEEPMERRQGDRRKGERRRDGR